MDSLTHIALGACVGEILLSKQLGKKALLWGVIAQNLPDIDSVAGLFVPAYKALLVHRGLTHSLFFAMIIGLLLAFLAKNIHLKKQIPFYTLAGFFCFQLALHDLLDTCNSYGTGLLEPFNHQRFSINLLYVADPLFTIGLLIAALLLMFKSNANPRRKKWAFSALGISAFYLCFAGFNKVNINKATEASFAAQRIAPSNYFTTPAPFNCMLWYIVASTDRGYYTAYRSVWDNAGQSDGYQYHAKNYVLLKNIPAADGALQNLKVFAGSYYTITKADDNLYLNILRFEQVQGWAADSAPFALSYSLSSQANQALLLQKGRLAGWNKNTLKIYFERIAGHQTINN